MSKTRMARATLGLFASLVMAFCALVVATPAWADPVSVTVQSTQTITDATGLKNVLNSGSTTSAGTNQNAAISSSNSNSVQLLQDVTLNGTNLQPIMKITSGTTQLTLDLNGHDLVIANEGGIWVGDRNANSGCTFTLTDGRLTSNSGGDLELDTSVSDGDAAISICGGSTLNLSADVSSDEIGISAKNGAGASGSMTLNMTAGKVDATDNGIASSAMNTGATTISISGGSEVDGGALSAGIYASNKTAVTTNRATVEGGVGVFLSGTSTLTADNSTFISDATGTTATNVGDGVMATVPAAAMTIVSSGTAAYSGTPSLKAGSSNTFLNDKTGNTNASVLFATQSGESAPVAGTLSDNKATIAITPNGTNMVSGNVPAAYFPGATTAVSGTSAIQGNNEQVTIYTSTPEQTTAAQGSLGNPVTTPVQGGGAGGSTNTPNTQAPQIAAAGFQAIGNDAASDPNNEVLDANTAINQAMGVTDPKNYVTYVTGGNNIFWIVLKGQPETSYGLRVTSDGANNTALPVLNTLAASSGSTSPQDAYTFLTNKDGVVALWFTLGSATTLPGTTGFGGGEFEAAANADLIRPGTYTINAWPAQQYANVQATPGSVQISGIAYDAGTTDNTANTIVLPTENADMYVQNSVGTCVFGMPGSSLSLLGYGTVKPASGDAALASWRMGSTNLNPGANMEMPAYNGNQYTTLTAVLGTPVTIEPTPSDTVNFPTGNGAFDDTVAANSILSDGNLVVGVAPNGALPTLPGLTWTGGAQASVADSFPGTAAFVGWYTYDATTGYTLYLSGSSIPATAESLTLQPLFAPVDVTWRPAVAGKADGVMSATPASDFSYAFTGFQTNGQTSNFTLSASINQDALCQALDVTSIAISDNAQAIFNPMFAAAVTAKLPSGTTGTNNVSGLQNVTYDGANGFKAAYVGEENGAFAFSITVPQFPAEGAVPGSIMVNLDGLVTTAGGDNFADVILYDALLSVNTAVQPTNGGYIQVMPTTDGQITLTAVAADGFTFDHWTVSGGQWPQSVDPKSATITVASSATGTWTANFVPSTTPTDSVNVMRLRNPDTQEHLYTTSLNEYNTLINNFGWEGENVAWVAPTSSSTPIYRLRHPEGGHLYTTSLNEYNYLDRNEAWIGEGIAMYSAPQTGSVPIYRLYNPSYFIGFAHLWTADFNEYTYQGSHGWNQENVAFYALSAPGM